jgi:hypothetical protein
MSNQEQTLLEALHQIAEIANVAVRTCEHNGNGSDGGTSSPNGDCGCTIKLLPRRLMEKAASEAIKINPVNAPLFGFAISPDGSSPIEPERLTLLVSKYWGAAARQITVSFMESTAADLRARILRHMNAWTRTCGISFVETRGTGQVRISRAGSGYWSYLGTDVRLIPSNRPTMNLQGFTMSTPESEFIRVVRHETGHTLGFPHEHMRRELVARIDPQKAYAYFLRTQGWDRQTVDQQVLTPLDDRSIMGTAADQTSIMCYQLPGSITRDGRPITGGVDINPTDYSFAGRIYPKPGRSFALEPELMLSETGEDWDASEDVAAADLEVAEVAEVV